MIISLILFNPYKAKADISLDIPFLTFGLVTTNDSSNNKTESRASNNTTKNVESSAPASPSSSTESIQDNSIDMFLSILKDPTKREILIKKLEEINVDNTLNNNNNDLSLINKYITNNAVSSFNTFFTLIKECLKAITKIDVLFVELYSELKSYSKNLVTAVLNIPSTINKFLCSKDFLSEITYTSISCLVAIVFIFISYVIEKNISTFFVSNYSHRLKGNRFLDKLLYISLALLMAFIPVVGASFIVVLLSLVCFSLVSVFFHTKIIFISVVVKCSIVWVLYRTLLIFVRKMLLVSFVLNFWGYLKATYKDVRNLYVWFRVFLTLFFIFILSFIVMYLESEIMINLHMVVIKVFFIIFAILLFIFLYRFKFKIQQGLLAFGLTTKYFYIRKLFTFLSKRFYILALIYVLVVLSSFILGNYGSLFYFLNATFFTIILIIIHHFLQYLGAKYIKRFFSHSFVELIDDLYGDDKNKRKLYSNILGNPKLEILLEGVFYYTVFFIFCLFVLNAWGISTLDFIKYIYKFPIIKPLTQIIICFVLILGLTLGILLSFRQRILYLTLHNRFEDINTILSLLLLFKNIYIIFCTITIAIVALNVFGVPVMTLIASTGILTLLVAFGAKDLMRNFFNALMSILESTFSVGDVVTIGSSSGTVEDITSAYVKLRDIEGKLHIIPFSDINKVINETKGFSYAYTVVTVNYDSNLSKVLTLLNSVSSDLMKDSNFQTFIVSSLEVFSTYNLPLSIIEIVCRIKTYPGKQYTVKREFLKRVKAIFNENGDKVINSKLEKTHYLIK